jgi:succinate dehydrogenase / fumarate reductase cytochrome b subunit
VEAILKMADATPGLRPRPVSPNIQLDGGIWRWHITMAASIFHRATGVGLYLGALVFMVWALSLASGADGYASFTSVMGSIPGKVVLFGFTLCVFYHLSNGVRHLFWDAGYGFEPKTATATAWVVIGIGVVGAVAFWTLLFFMGAL